jgi:outer membrane protein TolC
VAFDRLRAAEDRKIALDAAASFSEESYRLTEERYREGLVTVLELSEFQNTLIRTRLGAASARHDLALARKALLLAAGSLVLPEESR